MPFVTRSVRRLGRRALHRVVFYRRPVLRRRYRTRSLYNLASWSVFILAVLAAGTFWLGGRPTPGADPVISVWNARAASVHEFSLEDYVRGVVAAEMPASFHPEALKAQAVAARTYALRRVEGDVRLAELSGAHISSDFQRHQAWIDEAQFVAARPGAGEAQWARIGEAVDGTRGIILTYDGEPIEALYHSTSGGHTEDAARYFVGGKPYLRALPDPYGDHSPAHATRTVMSVTEVFHRLGVDEGAPRSVHVARRTEAGRADEVIVGEQRFTGRDVREALALRSSWFDVTVDDERIIFDVRGNGHGVGMSQYGADGMARAGYSFDQILNYYYPGTTVERRY